MPVKEITIKGVIAKKKSSIEKIRKPQEWRTERVKKFDVEACLYLLNSFFKKRLSLPWTAMGTSKKVDIRRGK